MRNKLVIRNGIVFVVIAILCVVAGRDFLRMHKPDPINPSFKFTLEKYHIHNTCMV